MVRWMRWHCPPDTGLEIRALAVWGRAHYLWVTEAPHKTEFYTWMGKKHFVSFKPPRSGTEPRTLASKAAVLTTTLGPPPTPIIYVNYQQGSLRHLSPFNPLTAGAAYIRVFTFLLAHKYHLLTKLKIKSDINQQYLKTVDLHFVKSE